MAEVEGRLTNEGQAWEPENTAITEEGIFYINPESGMATRVALYLADHQAALPGVFGKRSRQTSIVEMDGFSNLNEYHLLRCNALTQLEREKKIEGYRIAQRLDGHYYYRLLVEPKKAGMPYEAIRMIPDPRLNICPNCFFKVTSLLEGVRDLKRESFTSSYFFNVDFFRSWVRYGESSKSANSLANMYPKDWDEISRIRREQVHYHCESCGKEVTGSKSKRELHVHPTDHHKKKISFVRLQCLCQECLADHAPSQAKYA